MPQSVYTERYDRLCRLLTRARQDAGLTQSDLAERLDRPQSYVSKYERRQRRLDIVELLDVAEALRLDPCDVLRDIMA